MIDSMDKCDECNAVMYNGDYICCHGCHEGMKREYEAQIARLVAELTTLENA